MEPMVCVILVNYKGTEDTIACVKSLFNVNYTNYRIVIADNKSSVPLSKEDSYVFEDERVIILPTGDNLGFAGGNNFAIEYAMHKWNPDYYLLLNNDTVVDPDFMMHMVQKAESSDEIGLVTGKIYLYSQQKKIWYAGGALETKKCWTSHFGAEEIDFGQYDEDCEVTFATGCLWLLPKRTIEKVGLLSEEYFLYYEDADYGYKILQSGLRLIYCHKAIIYHKVSGSTGTYSDLERYYMVRNGLMFVQKYAKSRISAYFSHGFQYLKDLIKGRVRLRILIRAYQDFYKKKFGMQDMEKQIK